MVDVVVAGWPCSGQVSARGDHTRLRQAWSPAREGGEGVEGKGEGKRAGALTLFKTDRRLHGKACQGPEVVIVSGQQEGLSGENGGGGQVTGRKGHWPFPIEYRFSWSIYSLEYHYVNDSSQYIKGVEAKM